MGPGYDEIGGTLDLSGQARTVWPTEEIAAALACPAGLRVLCLDWNVIEAVPDGVGQLTSLTALTVRNEFRPVGGEVSDRAPMRLSPEIGKLAHLTELDLRGSMLETVPVELAGLTSLVLLSLAENKLTAVPDELCKLTSLRWLNLYTNALERLPEGLGALTNLETLSVADNRLAALPRSLASLPALRALHADYNTLESLPPLPASLRRLDLSGNRLAEVPADVGRMPDLAAFGFSARENPGLPEPLRSLPPGGPHESATLLHARCAASADAAPAEDLLAWLSAEDPLPAPDTVQDACIFVSGNWYDPLKVPQIAALAAAYAPCLRAFFLAGGVGRLTCRSAREAGGEAVELRARLRAAGALPEGVPTEVYLSGANTGDNVDWLLRTLAARPEQAWTVLVVDEPLLVRRVRATLAGRLAGGGAGPGRFLDVRVLASRRAEPLAALEAVHGGRAALARHMVYGEWERLDRYSAGPPAEPLLFSRAAAFGSGRHEAAAAAAARRLREQYDPKEAEAGLAALLDGGLRIGGAGDA